MNQLLGNICTFVVSLCWPQWDKGTSRQSLDLVITMIVCIITNIISIINIMSVIIIIIMIIIIIIICIIISSNMITNTTSIMIITIPIVSTWFIFNSLPQRLREQVVNSLCGSRRERENNDFTETGWSPWEVHPYCSMAIIRLSSDSKHLIMLLIDIKHLIRLLPDVKHLIIT